MKAARTTAPAGADAERQLEAFIGKFNSKEQRLIRAVRRALRQWFPTANELVWDNYNFFVIGYSPTERPSDSIVSFRRSGQRSRPVLYPWRESCRSQEVASRLRQSDSLHSP